MTSVWDKYKVDVPEGTCGAWKVERFTVSEDEARFENVKAVWKPGVRCINPGVFTRLTRNRMVVMSDTVAEVRDHLGIIHAARGQVLLHGLGIGMVLSACLQKKEVEHVLVIEKAPEVIQLVGPHYEERYGQRVTIVEGDAFTWKPQKGQRWNAVWHDICTDNLPEMKQLHRRFGRRTDWQGSWCRALCERYAR